MEVSHEKTEEVEGQITQRVAFERSVVLMLHYGRAPCVDLYPHIAQKFICTMRTIYDGHRRQHAYSQAWLAPALKFILNA
jgi:hypothetical protein